ncbi:MAG: hypothetical protein HND58_17055 [Planctomycetota bacterium]|nr:MAG: hypothetical protein HND58_17055 [Planctomycetota bacterium]
MPNRRPHPCSLLLLCGLLTAQAAAQASSDVSDPVTSLGEAPIAGLLEDLGPDTILYDMHIVTLANPFFEGRGATTIGNERAADYITFHFEQIGLLPAFSESVTVDGTEVVTPNATYSQRFAPSDMRRGRGGSRPVRVLDSEASIRIGDGQWATLIPDLDYSVLGCSGTGEVEGELAFVGYSIPSGENGYLGYPPGTDLTGKIAVAAPLRAARCAGREPLVRRRRHLVALCPARAEDLGRGTAGRRRRHPRHAPPAFPARTRHAWRPRPRPPRASSRSPS